MLGDTRRGSSGAFAEPVLLSKGTAKSEPKAVSPVGKLSRLSGRRSTVVWQMHERPISLKKQKGRQSPNVAHVSENLEPPKRRQGPHPKQHYRGGAPSHSSRHRGSLKNEGEARGSGLGIYLCHRRGARLLNPLRSCSAAGSGKLDRESAFPLALPSRYSSG